jgi:hypothetical protein
MMFQTFRANKTIKLSIKGSLKMQQTRQRRKPSSPRLMSLFDGGVLSGDLFFAAHACETAGLH